jgi:hypothetical protein
MIQFENYKPVPSKIFSKTIFILGLLTILLFSIFVNPDRSKFLTCYFRELTGHRCPSCGLTHSIYAISHFHIQKSFIYHPMGLFVYFILLFLLVKFSFEIITKKEIQIKINRIITKITFIIFLTSWLSFWIIRLLNEL